MSVRWGVRFSLIAMVLCGVIACSSEDGGSEPPALLGLPEDAPMLARTYERTGDNPHETIITKANAANLIAKWQFRTGAPVAATPSVATIDLPNEGPTRIVFVGSYDGKVYAIRADEGTQLWAYEVKPHEGVSYGIIASSAAIAEVDGEPRVFVGGGMTMYSLDAVSGAEIWQFDAGTGCQDCDTNTERNEILSSPAVLPEQDLVAFGMDVNDRAPGKGGFYGLSAKDGHLHWYFDVETGETCRPDDDDDVRKFDGYHNAEQLGLEDDFFSTRGGCDFDRTETACGNVWSPVSVDFGRELLYFATSNCDTDDDPQSAPPTPPMTTHNEALVAVDFDGEPVWSWRPREIDNDDYAFGAAPNLFTATIEGEEREVVGIGNKDGSYYLLDRDGENELTGEIEPYWTRNVVEGGAIGGITGTPAVMDGRIYFGVGIGEDVEAPQKPSAWALDAGTGEVVWSQEEAAPFFGGTSAIPGVVFMGGIDFSMRAIDADTGEILAKLPLGGLGFSQAVPVDGVVYMGSGFGAQGAGGTNIEAILARAPAGVWAFCIDGEADCAPLPTPSPAP
ncbi:MAG: PQQ-binding-like beta-propeller repeat protein [Dehalococcoidia bacterium]